MDNKLVLAKCVALLFRESQVENLTESSKDLVRTVVDRLRINDSVVGVQSQKSTTLSLKDLVLDMCQNKKDHLYDLVEFKQQIKFVTNGDTNLYDTIVLSIENELTGPVLKRTVTNYKKTIAQFAKEQKAQEIIAKAYKDLSFNRHNITDLDAYLLNVGVELEATRIKVTSKDAAIVHSMKFSDDESMREAFESVASSNSAELPFRTGWIELDDALQGGPRPGDCVLIAADQHNYKTGTSLSLFSNIALFNSPKTKDKTKKPLLYRVSLEDPVKNNAQFLYQLLMYEETKKPVSVKGVSVEEMWTYVKRRMCATGYEILIEEVNPLHWNYMSVINRVIELEAEGYAVELLELDYMAKLQTTGCAQGATGDDILDMLSRLRSFCSSNGILFITPHQLSTEAKRLAQTVPADQFLHTIKGGGYFEKSKGLGRIYDIGILQSKIETDGGDYLHMVVDKHRFPSVVESSLKSWFLAFPSCKMPIPPNYDIENYKVLRKIPRTFASKDDSFFS